HRIVEVAEIDQMLLLNELRIPSRDLIQELALRQRLAPQHIDVALEMQELVEMHRMRVFEDRVLQIVNAFFDAFEKREVRVDHLIYDRVEEKVRTVRENPRVRR